MAKNVKRFVWVPIDECPISDKEFFCWVPAEGKWCSMAQVHEYAEDGNTPVRIEGWGETLDGKWYYGPNSDAYSPSHYAVFLSELDPDKPDE